MKFFCALLFLLAPFAWAQPSVTDGVLINADNMYRDLEKRMVRLEGNVQVAFKGQNLSCDKAEIDLNKQQIIATGNVIMFSERAHVEGERVVFNYKRDTGFIYKGFVQSGQVVFEGDVIQKMSDKRYVVSNASFTACDTCPPGWSFSGRNIDAEIGGYARIRRPVFRVGGVPIMILPSLIVPLKTDRQSGFLVPGLELLGRGGIGIRESYFWAIDRSRDLTITPKYYHQLGAKLHTDYRYVLAENARGRLQSAWIREREFVLSRDTKAETEDKIDIDRWYAWYNHHLEMPNGYVHRAELLGASDLRYQRDFPVEMPGHGDPALNNHLSVSKSGDSQFASAQVDRYTNLLKSYPLADNDDAVHRFPEIKYSVREQSLLDSRLFFGLDVNYVNFARDKYTYDDVNVGSSDRIALGPSNSIIRDGRFDAGRDIMRTGQRLDITPTFTLPFKIANALDVLPVVTFRETQYRFNPTETAEASGFSPTAARRYMQTDVIMRTEFSRIFGQDNPTGERMKHSIEPEIGYSYIPWIRRPEHPFFGEFSGLSYSRQYDPITDADIDFTGTKPSNTGLQFDYNDRTYEKQVVNFGLSSRLTKKSMLNSSAEYKSIALFRLWQSYDFNEADAPTPHPWSSINGLADFRFQHFETYTTAAYDTYANVTNLSTRVLGRVTPTEYLQVTYTRNFLLDEDRQVQPNGESRFFGWGGGFSFKYFDAVAQIDYEAKSFTATAYSYAFNIRPPGKCWVMQFGMRQVVGGEPDFDFGVNFNFGGDSNKPIL